MPGGGNMPNKFKDSKMPSVARLERNRVKIIGSEIRNA